MSDLDRAKRGKDKDGKGAGVNRRDFIKMAGLASAISDRPERMVFMYRLPWVKDEK